MCVCVCACVDSDLHVYGAVESVPQGRERVSPIWWVEVRASSYSVLSGERRSAVAGSQRVMLEVIVPK